MRAHHHQTKAYNNAKGGKRKSTTRDKKIMNGKAHW